MIRREDITYIDSLDRELGAPIIQNTAVISENIVAENEGFGSVTFTVTPEPIASTGHLIDTAQSRVFECWFGREISDEELAWISRASFVDVVKRYAKGIGGLAQ